jgi:DNA modification methylase
MPQTTSDSADLSRIEMRRDLKIIHLPLDKLIPYARNARTHGPDQVAQIAGSMREFGWTNPVLLDEEHGIIAGHGRVLAARKLKLTEDIPCIVLAGLTPAQKRAIVIADNKLAMNSGWDTDLLIEELGDIAGDGIDLNIVGFSDAEMAILLSGIAPGTDPHEDDTPSPPVDPVSVLGDVWILGRHRLVCGDSRDTLVVDKALAGVKPHLMVTDPPYGVNYTPNWRSGLDKVKRSTGKVKNDDVADWRQVYALFPGDVAYIWHAGTFGAMVQEGLEDCGFEIRSQIIWVKPHFVLSRGHYHPQHESCFYSIRKTAANGHWSGSHNQSTVWQIANGTFQGRADVKPEDAKTGHGTQKPVECMRRPIENNSSPGQAIYEPFSGSFSTGIACELTGRSCHAIEINPSYVDVGIQRWERLTGHKAVLEGDGRTYTEIEETRRKEAA